MAGLSSQVLPACTIVSQVFSLTCPLPLGYRARCCWWPRCELRLAGRHRGLCDHRLRLDFKWAGCLRRPCRRSRLFHRSFRLLCGLCYAAPPGVLAAMAPEPGVEASAGAARSSWGLGCYGARARSRQSPVPPFSCTTRFQVARLSSQVLPAFAIVSQVFSLALWTL